MENKLEINQPAPKFDTKAFQEDEIKTVKLDSYKGKWVVLFFYPADFTFICPTELGELADHYDELKKMGAGSIEHQHRYRLCPQSLVG